MPVFKNEDNGTWYVMARYVNWKGERKQKCKRGFATKKEAQEWERMFQLQNSSDLDMSFEAFTELYINDVKNRLKENTWLTKEHIIRTKILPYFGKLKISEISTKEIITWQNEMLAYRDDKKKPYSQTYLKTLHNQLSAMSAESENGQLARQVLDEYYRGFQERNPQLRVFSAHLHLDEATPHLHIDFVPFTTGSKRGLNTRVSLKQALAAQGFKGGSRGDTEWSQWVLSEKEQLAAVMERYGIEWEQKGTHEKHLSVLDYKKQERTEEIERLENKITDKQTEFETLSKRIENFDKGTTALSQMQSALENAPEYQLSEPQGFMTAKSYKSKVAEPLIKRLKSLIKTLMVRCFQAIDDYQRLNQTNASLYRSNERLKSQNRQLTSDNNRLREEIKDYKLLRKVFGSRQIDSLLEQARQSKQRGTRFRNNQYER